MLPRVNVIRTDETDYLLFSTHESISTTIFTNGYWAKLITDISCAFCAGLDAPLVLDVGANLGAYAVPLAQRLADQGGSVFAYEPQRIVFYQLCGNAFLNRRDNLHLFHLAIGSADGEIDIANVDYATSINVGSFALDPFINEKHNAITTLAGSTKVSLKRLDSLAFPKPPALIKIDVEGLELEVLKGAQSLITTSGFPPLILEAWIAEWYATRRQTLLDYLKGMGYDYFLLGDEIFAQHPQHPRQFEFSGALETGVNMVRTK